MGRQAYLNRLALVRPFPLLITPHLPTAALVFDVFLWQTSRFLYTTKGLRV